MTGPAEPRSGDHPAFLAGGGEAGALMRRLDWAATPLGPPADWPETLRMLASLMLASTQPMFVVWGAGQSILYNDGYAAILAHKHPAAMGRPFLDVWPEIRGDIEPLVARTYAGEAIQMDDIPLTVMRRGYMEEAHFAFSYTPVRDPAGGVAGFFCACAEITGKVAAERRDRLRARLTDRLRDLDEPLEIMATASRMLGEHLGVDCVGYAEADETGETVTILGGWTASGAAGVSGDHRLGAYGPPLAGLRDGRTAVVEDVADHPLTAAQRASFEAIPVRALIDAPLVRDGRLAGVLFALSARPRRWTRDEVAMVEEVAERTWAVLRRVRADAAARESREMLELALDAAGQGAWDHDVTTGRLVWDARTRALVGTGEDPEPSCEDFVERFVHPEDRARVRAVVDAALDPSGDGRCEVEYRVGTAGGGTRWLASRGRALFEGEGTLRRAVRMLGTVRDVTDARRTAEALQESEARFRNMADNAPVMIWVGEPGGQLSYISRPWFGFTGQAPGQELGLGWLDAIHPDDRVRVRAAFNEGRLTRETVSVEYRLRRRDGVYRWMLDTARPRIGPGGQILGQVGSVIDLDERKEAEEALRRSEATLNAILEALPVGVIVAAANGRVLRDNAANRELWGLPPETMSWEDYSDWQGWWPDTGKPIAAHEWGMARALLNGETVKDELVECARFDTGERRFFLNNAAPVRDAGGRIVAGVVAELDVTERLAAERALAESEARFRTITDAMPQMVWSADADGQRDFFNARWYEFTGLDRGAGDGWGWLALVHEDDRRGVEAAWRRSVATGEPFETECRFRRYDGAYRWVLGRGAALCDRNGCILRWMGTLTDIHEMKTAEEQRTLLVDELNHRVKNTLAIVQSLAHQTFRGVDLPPGVALAFEGRLGALSAAHDLLTRTNWERATLADVVREATRHAFGTGLQQLEIDGPHAMLEPKQAVSFAMALHELSTNAMKYGALSTPCGRVSIRWAVTDGRLRFTWAESNGPPVLPPRRRSFGMRLVEQALAQELSGTVRVEFARAGLVCTIDAPLDGGGATG